MPRYNLLPWRAAQHRRRQRWVGVVWFCWGVLGVLWWRTNVGLLQQQAELLARPVEPPPSSQLDEIWVSWQQEPLHSAQEVWAFWSLLADITPAEMALQTVHWQPPTITLSGVVREPDALVLLLGHIARQPRLAAPQWRHWVPDAGAGAQFELDLKWAFGAPY